MQAARSRLQTAASLAAVLAGLTVLGSLAAPAFAASSPGSTTAVASVLSSITLSGLTPSFTLTGAPGTTVTSPSAVTMNVKTNNTLGYTVTVQAAAATMTGATTGNTDTIPVSALTVKETTGVTYSPVSNIVATTVHSQNAKSATTGDTVTNDYQMVMPFVNSDNYSVTLNYVAATK